ncbi:MAG: hypothetical protein JXA13_00505 [Anaerolineales bacterium]|nr:hypothetical protein [Anaerolineales bacterium]
MRRGRIYIFLILIVVVGLGVAFLAFGRLLPGLTAQETPEITFVDIVISQQSIPQGAEIKEDALGTMSIPQDKYVTVMIRQDEIGEIVGKVARYPLEPGVPLTQSMIVESTAAIALEGPQWASIIPPGMTATTIPTTRLESVAFGVSKGAHVNLTACMLFVDIDPSFQSSLPNNIGTLVAPANVPPGDMPGVSLILNSSMFEGVTGPVQGRTEVEPSYQQGIYIVPGEEQRPRMVCQMILQDVVVMRMGTFPLTEAAQVGSTQSPEEEVVTPIVSAEIPDLLTLIVSPQDSVALTYLMYSGAKLSLTLRNASDESRVATESATLQYLLSQYNIPVPAKLPYAVEPRIDELILPFLPNDVITVNTEE